VGDEAVGKSSIVHRFAADKFTEDYITTIGIDFAVRVVETSEENIPKKLQVWDTGNKRAK